MGPRWTIGSAVVLLAVVLGLGVSPPGAAAQVPSPLVLRFEEDYARLADTAAELTGLNALKYVPFGKTDSGAPSGNYASFGADVRFLYEWLTNPAGRYSDYYLSRVHLHADVHWASGWRAFVQPASALEYGDLPARQIDLNALYLLNAFVDVPLLRRDGESVLEARLGRFEMHYGDGRLMTYSNPINVRHYFDGARLRYRRDRWTADAFLVNFELAAPGVFDDGYFDGPEYTWGTWVRRALGADEGPRSGAGGFVDDGPFGPRANDLAFFYLGHRDREAAYFNAAGRETRHTIGVHVDHQRAGGWDYQATVAGQIGRITEDAAAETPGAAEQDVLAFGASASAGYTWGLGEGRSLRVAALADYWSGDRDSTDARYTGFNPLYPRNSYYRGTAAPFASNFYNARPLASLTLGNWNFTTSSTWFWRASADDGFYLGWYGAPSIAPTASDSRHLGRQIEATARYGIPGTAAYVLLVYANFSPGAFVEENPQPGEIDHFGDVFLVWKF